MTCARRADAISQRLLRSRYRQIEVVAQLLRVTLEPLGAREPDDFKFLLRADEVIQ